MKHPNLRHRSKAGQIITTGPVLEFVQLWDHLARIRQVKELELGNYVGLSGTFHVGNSEQDRAHWKRLHPEFADQIDATPPARNLPMMGSPAVLVPLSEDQLLAEARLCGKLGLYFDCPNYIVKAAKEDAQADHRLLEKVRKIGGKYFRDSCVLGENTSSLSHARPYSYWQSHHGMDPAKMTLQTMHDWFVGKDRDKVAAALKGDHPTTTNLEASIQFRLALELGVEVPILEFVPSDPGTGLPAARGAARAYHSPYWGVALAMGWFRAPIDDTLPARLRITYNHFYAAGASWFDNINCIFHIYGAPSGFFSEQARPPLRAGEKEFRDFDDPHCVAVRQVMRDFHRFNQFHRRPEGGPRVRIGFALGNLDGYNFGDKQKQSHLWGVSEPGWEAGDAEATWDHFLNFGDAEAWYPPPQMYYWQKDPIQVPRHGTPPCGQIDIVPTEAPLAVLKTYRCLVFLGWNTMTQPLYDKLKSYVRAGGRLLMSLPHLSTQVHRRPQLELIRGGDLRDLFGVKVRGKGQKTQSVRFLRELPAGPYVFPDASLYLEGAELAQIDLAGASIVAESVDLSGPDGLADAGPGAPVLVQNHLGRGFAYLLTTWSYPGPHLPALLTDILRSIANAEQDDIAVEGELVSYAIYDDAKAPNPLTTVYVVNKSLYGQTLHPRLVIGRHRIPLRVGGHDMRVVWLSDTLMVSPFDPWVRIEDIRARRGSCDISLTAQAGKHHIQLEGLGQKIDRVLLDGRRKVLKQDHEGAMWIGSSLKGSHRLSVHFK